MVFFDPNKHNPFKRKGMGEGMGSGYHNLAPTDPMVHSLSARGVRVKRVVMELPNATIYQSDVIDPNSAEFLKIREENPNAILQEVPLDEVGKMKVQKKGESDELWALKN